MKSSSHHSESRRNQFLVGFGALIVVSGIILIVWFGQFIPGFVGEWFRMLAGVATTPILMEACLLLLGIVVVIALNAWNHRREGDEFVDYEHIERRDTISPPAQSRDVMQALDPIEPNEITRLEGALAIGDYAAAGEILAQFDEVALGSSEVLKLRIELAEFTGQHELAARLKAQHEAH